MANKKSHHPKNNAEIEHKIDVNEDLDLEKQDATESERVEINAEDKVATMQHEEKANTRSSESDVTPKETVIVKKTGSALGLLAILIALGLGGVGYYFGQQQVDEMQQKLTALQTQLQQKNVVEPIDIPNFDAEKSQLAKLVESSQVASNQISALNQELAAKQQHLSALQQQVQH